MRSNTVVKLQQPKRLFELGDLAEKLLHGLQRQGVFSQAGPKIIDCGEPKVRRSSKMPPLACLDKLLNQGTADGTAAAYLDDAGLYR